MWRPLQLVWDACSILSITHNVSPTLAGVGTLYGMHPKVSRMGTTGGEYRWWGARESESLIWPADCPTELIRPTVPDEFDTPDVDV